MGTETRNVITNLRNHLLVATAELNGSFFERAVIYLATQNEDGSMGFIINQPMNKVMFTDIARSMGIEDMMDARASEGAMPIIYRGGPVENTRGFVLHTPDYKLESTLNLSDDIALSAQADIVGDMARGHGPRHANFCLGYAGWDQGQLEREMHSNSWLVVPANRELLFTLPPEQRYDAATSMLGLNALNFSVDVGRA